MKRDSNAAGHFRSTMECELLAGEFFGLGVSFLLTDLNLAMAFKLGFVIISLR